MSDIMIDIVLEWARAMRAVRTARIEYMRCIDLISERLSFLDDHPDYRRSDIELERDRVLQVEQKELADEVMESEAHENRRLEALRQAADAELTNYLKSK